MEYEVTNYAQGRVYLIGRGYERTFFQFKHIDLGIQRQNTSEDTAEKPSRVSEDAW